MSKIIVFHKACGGPALDQTDLDETHTFDFLADEEDFSLTCITCLEEITDRSELTASEFLPQ
jgi:hypothetical protein